MQLEPQRMTAALKLMEDNDVFVALPWEYRGSVRVKDGYSRE